MFFFKRFFFKKSIWYCIYIVAENRSQHWDAVVDRGVPGLSGVLCRIRWPETGRALCDHGRLPADRRAKVRVTVFRCTVPSDQHWFDRPTRCFGQDPYVPGRPAQLVIVSVIPITYCLTGKINLQSIVMILRLMLSIYFCVSVYIYCKLFV